MLLKKSKRFRQRPLRKILFGAAVIWTALCPSAEVLLAQTGNDGKSQEDDPWAGVEELIVTGGISTAELIGPGESFTAFDAEDLAVLGAVELSGLADYTPNLAIRTAGGTSATFFIRGVGLNDFTSNASGAVAIYQDDIALNSPALQLGQLFDVEDVQILRGPQGAGPGRNASGGAIRVYSRKPSGDVGASFRSEIGEFDGSGALSQNYEGAFEVPVVADILAARFAFRVTMREPIVKNRCGNLPPVGLARVNNFGTRRQGFLCNETGPIVPLAENPTGGPAPLLISGVTAGLPKTMNDANAWAGRAQFRLQPPETDMEWMLNVHGGRVDQLARVGVALGTSGSRVTPDGTVEGYLGGTTQGYRQPEIAAREAALFTAFGGLPSQPRAVRDPILGEARRVLGENLAKRLDASPFEGDYNRDGQERMTSLGGFIRGEFDLGELQFVTITGAEHYDREIAVDADFTPDVIFETERSDSATQVSQDFRIEGEREHDSLQWESGGYFLWEDLDYESRTQAGSSIVSLNRIYSQETISFGIYSGFVWDFLEDLTLEAGARYNWESKKFDVNLFRGGRRDVCGPPLNPNNPNAEPAQDCTDRPVWHAPTGMVKLNYRVDDSTSFYWKYNRGWKGGQLNAGGSSGVAFNLAEPETIDAFELGFNGDWFDGRLAISASVFYYLYQDYQVFTSQNEPQAPPQQIVINASDAQLYGAEVEATIIPIEGLDLQGRFGWEESEFLEFSQRVFRQVDSAPGDPPILAPVELQFTGNRLPNTPRFTASGSAQYTIDLGRSGQLVPRYDFSWTDDVTFDQSNGRGAPNNDGLIFLPEHAIGQRAFWIHNLRLAYRTENGKIEVAGWVRNLTNTLYKTLAFDASQVGLVGSYLGDPRSYGASLSFEW